MIKNKLYWRWLKNNFCLHFFRFLFPDCGIVTTLCIRSVARVFNIWPKSCITEFHFVFIPSQSTPELRSTGRTRDLMTKFDWMSFSRYISLMWKRNKKQGGFWLNDMVTDVINRPYIPSLINWFNFLTNTLIWIN